MTVTASAIVVAFGSSPHLVDCIEALFGSRHVELEVVLVDNGSPEAAAMPTRPGLHVVRPGTNLGFAGGCNEGVRHATGDVVVLVNPDAIVEPDAVAALVAAARRPGTGVASASLRLADRPTQLNSAGNEVHFLGFGWCGRFGDPADTAAGGPVTAATGAAMAVTRDVWQRLEGLSEPFFAYHEDAEMSLRCWQQELAVVFVPDAVVHHHYEFGRNRTKQELLERNRLLLLLTLYERRTLLVLAPALLVCELAITALALAGGWGAGKVRGWRWLFLHRRLIRERRAWVQAARTVGDRELAPLLARHLRPGNYPLPAVARPLDATLAGYWLLVSRLL